MNPHDVPRFCLDRPLLPGPSEERLIWREEFETLDQARDAIAGYVDRYHHRPHSSLNYRTPLEVRQTWEDPFRLQKHAA